jgi:hypothetical protein
VTRQQALAFVEKHGVVLQAARGPVPSFADFVAGERIRGSWWGHPKGQEIFRLTEAVIDSGQVLVCKLIDGKVTYVHRRLWPALVRLSSRFKRAELAKVWSEHTSSGAHVLKRVAYPKWVPPDVLRQARSLTERDAQIQLAVLLDGPRP